MPNKENITELFFALVRCGIGKEKSLPHCPTPEQWQELFDMAKKQTLVGIIFDGMETLPTEQRPPKDIIFQWYSLCENIKKQNIDLNKKVVAISKKFKEEGFNNCILKGQGIAQLYPKPLLRTPGDIDIWLDGGDKKVIAYVKKFIPDCSPTYHHVDFPISDDVDIEVHYRPSWMCNPFINRKIQKFFAMSANEQFTNIAETSVGVFPIATVIFNRIFILQHIFRHLFFEGIGIRQILDYYFVIQQPITENEKREYIKLLKEFGLYKFATAITFVMQRIFAMDEEQCIVKANKKEGEFLLNEIMAAGNFGKYDKRYIATQRGLNIAHVSNLIKRTIVMLSHYPSEMFWDPFFRIWHYFWRKKNKS